MSEPIVLGLNCAHDAAAAVAIGGTLRAAISEERLTRIKHAAGFPHRAVAYCLKEAGLNPETARIDRIVINQFPPATFERLARQCFAEGAVGAVVSNPSHHYLHACYAEIFTDRRPLVILVVDGCGYTYAEHQRQGSPLLGPAPPNPDMWEALTAYFVDERGSISLLMKEWGEWREPWAARFPSLGHMYGLAAEHVFGSWVHAGKLMGLSAFGNPGSFSPKPIVTLTDRGVEIDTDWLLDAPSVRFQEKLEHVPVARDIAAKVQAELERAMMHLCRLLRERSGCDTICLTGGVALNSVFNGRLVREGPFEHVVVTPGCSDAGTAIGAAAFGYKTLTGRRLQLRSDMEFLGREYREDDIHAALRECPGVRFQQCDDPLADVVRDLTSGKIIGWFDGRAEFGPRALGHRSILADPRVPGLKDRLNSRVKFRESFRPYAAAVLEEQCSAWFQQAVDSPHMLMVATVRPERRELIPAVLHVDDTCRLQTVGKNYPGSLRELLERFFAATATPLVLNTSLNVRGQPIAETPRDALDCLVKSGLDVLYLGRFRVESIRMSWPELIASRPVAAGAYYLVGEYETHDHQTKLRQSWVWQGNRRIPVSADERDLLPRISGTKTVAEIASEVPHKTLDTVAESVRGLCDRGILSLEQPAGVPVSQ